MLAQNEILSSRAHDGVGYENAMCLRHHLGHVRCRGAFQTTLHTPKQAIDGKFSIRRPLMDSRDEQEVEY